MLNFSTTLYWFTVEFGLIQTGSDLRIYGAGIVSSKSESIYSLESEIPKRIKFNISLMNTEYQIDSLQKTYFIVDSFDALFNALRTLDWRKLKNE